MTGFVASLQSRNCIIVIVDDETNANKISGVYKINERNIAIILFEYKTAIEFCNEHLKKFSANGNFTDIIKEANDALAKTYKKYVGKPFSIVFASLDSNDFDSSYYAIWIQDGKPKGIPIDLAGVYSTLCQDLCQYIISKTYSKYMPLNETIDLMGYVLLQCNKVLKIENSVNMIILSQKGIEKVETEKLNDIISKAESIDNALKKDFSDFFITTKEKKG